MGPKKVRHLVGSDRCQSTVSGLELYWMFAHTFRSLKTQPTLARGSDLSDTL